MARYRQKSIIKLFKAQTYLSMHVANLWCIQNDKKYKYLYDTTIYLYRANNTALMTIDISIIFGTIIHGLGYHDNQFPLIKYTSLDRMIMNYYFMSKRLKNIINK